MKASHLLTTISLIGFSSGLTGCASLQGAMAKFKSGEVTTIRRYVKGRLFRTRD